MKSNGVYVAGALVTVKYIYPNGSTVTMTGTTNASGYATFLRNVTSKGTYKLQVTGVAKSGLTYNVAGNVITIKSLTIS